MTSIEKLGNIFGSKNKVKIMRLFLFNPDTPFDSKDIALRAKVNSQNVRREMKSLEKIGMVKKKVFQKSFAKLKRKKKTSGWILNPKFQYLKPIRSFLIDASPLKHDDIIEKFKKVGSLKFLVISGVFIQDFDSRVDILIVGDRLKKGLLENAIGQIEAEIGKEIQYTSFDTSDFEYRLAVCDKLVRDILDYPHEVVIDKIDVS